MSTSCQSDWTCFWRTSVMLSASLWWWVYSCSALESSSYSVSHWEMKDGLPLNKVRAIVQTRDGYLWVGTFNGLARFDGVRFRVFDVANTPALRNNAIESLCEDQEGRLWMGDNLGGVTVFTGGRFEQITMPTNWPAKPMLRLAAAANGTMWAMNDEGSLLPVTHGRAGEPFQVAASPIALATDNAGAVWAAVGGRLCRLEAGHGPVPVVPQPGVVKGWRALFPAQAGGLWILDGDWLRRWQDGRWVEDRGHNDWGTIVLSAFLETPAGKILGGSFKEGIHILDRGGRMEQLSEANGLAHNWAYCLTEDREGNIWVGTGNGGLNVLYPRRVAMVGTAEQWRSSAILSVSPDSQGGLWIGTEGAGIYQLQNGELVNLPGGDLLWQTVANSVMEDRLGRLWVGTWGAGAGVREGGAFRPAYELTPEQRIALTVFESRTGDIWVGTKGGAGRLHEGTWTWLESGTDLPRAAVRCFAETADGDIWIGLDGGGISRWQAGKLTRFQRRDGLSSDYVRTLFADADGSLWIGTRSGLSRLKDGRFASVTTRHGLPNDVICQIVDDGSGHFWMSSFGGLFRVAREELNLCADGKVGVVTCLVCDGSGGLATLEVSEQGQPAGCRTPDGRLWFATGRGLAMVIPDQVSPNLLPPPVRIEEVLVDGEALVLPLASDEVSPGLQGGSPISSRRRLAIPPGGRQYEFRYTGLSLANPGRVVFRYRLEGLHQDWVEAGTRRSAFYTDLPPGDYVFRVVARNADGVWNEQGAAMPLRVLPQFWQTWWFKLTSRLGVVVAVGLTVLVIVRRRAHRKLEALERQQAVERERARIARDIHDDLGSNLTRIVMLSESARGSLAETQPAVADLDEICQTGRELTLQLSEIVWAVNPEHDTLDSLATYAGKYAHDFLAAAGVRCRLDLPLALPSLVVNSPVRHNVLLAFKEALNNAARHARAQSVLVALRLNGESFSLTVQDDGRGLGGGGGGLGGHGLGNMRRRLKDVGGDCQVTNVPGGGTCVRLVVPLPAPK